MTSQHGSREYHLNGLRRYLIGVAVSLTTALVCQSMALVWWAGAITARVEIMEKSVGKLTDRLHTIETWRPSRP
jgi:hypothetical protein